jgi:hypothetical protein
MEPTSTAESPAYERGDALEDLLRTRTDGTSPTDPAPAPRLEDTIIHEFSKDEYWEWLGSLMEEGSELDEHLDDLLEAIYDLEPAFYDRAGHRQLRELLGRLHEVRTSVRAFEQDVEQLTLAFAKTDAIETEGADNAELTLASIKRTYDRAYDLCLYKLDRISDGWITATNLLISLTILIVTILFWMEFR